jgi:hypothetical protein
MSEVATSFDELAHGKRRQLSHDILCFSGCASAGGGISSE